MLGLFRLLLWTGTPPRIVKEEVSAYKKTFEPATSLSFFFVLKIFYSNTTVQVIRSWNSQFWNSQLRNCCSIIAKFNLCLSLLQATSSKHLLQWFATNIGNYTGGHQFHPLVSPFPLGLKPHMGSAPYRNPIPYYREIFLKTMNDTEEMTMKNNTVFAGYISRTH